MHDCAIKLLRIDLDRGVAAPQLVERLVANDGRHPAHRCGKMTVIIGGIVPNRDIALLQNFLGEFALMHYTQREAKQFR
jgi:hypothetical protein